MVAGQEGSGFRDYADFTSHQSTVLLYWQIPGMPSVDTHSQSSVAVGNLRWTESTLSPHLCPIYLSSKPVSLPQT